MDAQKKKIEHGLFIVFEGGEGSGKTTQIRKLFDWLVGMNYDVILTKQPGGDEHVCKNIRSLVLDPQYFGMISPRTEFLLFMADKAQHVDTVLRPALADGKIVLCDRYLASTYAYQVAARASCSHEEFDFVARYAIKGLLPHVTVWLDVDPAVGLQRNGAVPSQQLRFEKESTDFHTKVHDGYETYFSEFVDPSQVFRIDANGTIEDGHAAIVENIKTVLSEP